MNTELITSVQNPRIKALVKLRDRQGGGLREEIVIDGRREIGRALDAGAALREAFFCRPLLSPEDERLLLQRAAERGARLIEVTEPVFAKIAYGQRAEGVVATADRPRTCLADLRLGERPLIGVVEGVEKPGNLGAILRSADGAGIEALLAVDPATDVYGANVIRASLGTVFRVPLVEIPAAEAVSWLRERGLRMVAADPAADRIYTDVDLTVPAALVFGSETAGLTSAWRRPEVISACVPMRGLADSLNVSITAALFFYEALRQRSAQKG